MRILIALLIWPLLACTASAQNAEVIWPVQSQPDFVAVAFHDVVDRREELSSDAITTVELVRFFDWLKGNGWTAISLDDIDRARSGTKPLPKKPVLLTFDDGYESAYSRVYPLLMAYRYPAIIAVTGAWMEGSPGSMINYGDEMVPRSTFLSWDQVREMVDSGLVEIASHSFDLHTGILANPQGNLLPAAVTWAYDPVSKTYEDDHAYRLRIRTDLARARRQMETELKQSPRVLVWPFGRRTKQAIEEAEALGFSRQLTLTEASNVLTASGETDRLYVSRNPKLVDLARAIRFDEPISETRRIACFALDELGRAATLEAAEELLGRMVDIAYGVGANIVVLDVDGVPPVDATGVDVLSHAVWQMRTRAGAEVYLRLPLGPANGGKAPTPELYADMLRRAKADGLVFDADSSLLGAGAADAPPSSVTAEIRIRRDALDLSTLLPRDRAAMEAFRAAAAIDPDLKLMLVPATPIPTTRWPAPVADLLLLPAAVAGGGENLVRQLQRADWLSPSQAPRVAITMPAGSLAAIEKEVHAAQVHGATALALCPQLGSSALTAADASILSAAFSSVNLPRVR